MAKSLPPPSLIRAVDKAALAIRDFLDKRKDPGWTEMRQSWVKGSKLLKALLVGHKVNVLGESSQHSYSQTRNSHRTKRRRGRNGLKKKSVALVPEPGSSLNSAR